MLNEAGFSRIFVSVISVFLVAVIRSPYRILAVYFFCRPLVQPSINLGNSYWGGIPLSSVLTGALFISFIILIARKDIKFTFSLGTLNLHFLLIIWLAIVNPYNIISISGISTMLKLFTGLLCALVAYNSISNKDDMIKVAKLLVISSIIPVCFGLYQKISGTGHAWQENQYSGLRIDSLFGRYNEFGIYLCLMICVLLIVILNEKKTKLKLFWVGLLLLQGLCLIYSLNRGSWICLSVSILGTSILYFKKIKFVYLIGPVIIVAIFFSGQISERFDMLDQKDEYGHSLDTASGRINYWKYVISVAVKKPITGWGIGSASIVMEKYYNTEVPPHNDYVKMFLEGGVISASIYIAMLLLTAMRNFFIFKKYNIWKFNFPVCIASFYFLGISCSQNIYTNVILFPLALVIFASNIKLNSLCRL